MTISTLDLFSIGVGPSSSHTVGPMRAALDFSTNHVTEGSLVKILLRGSLAATGAGHGTDRAVLLGLVGYDPEHVSATDGIPFGAAIPARGTVSGPKGTVSYDLTFDRSPHPKHPNCLAFSTKEGQREETDTYFSVGGGFILTEAQMRASEQSGKPLGSGVSTTGRCGEMPYPFSTARELLEVCVDNGLSIPEIMLANETSLHGDQATVTRHLDRVWEVMQACIDRGLRTEGTLPGGLKVHRRAPELHRHLREASASNDADPLRAMEWINLYALAVNEENAAGGQVVTAPTNGAAGIVPAVMRYAAEFLPGLPADAHRDYLLTAAAVGIIIKENASISGAEVGCQGEVGSASAMAAAGLCQLLGGDPEQVEHAAEVALEHNLGLTCDPVGGLVQIPCIERNAIGAVKAVNAARLALLSTGNHRVTLDDAVRTMASTGRDMLSKYKETATGGLAVQLGLPVNLTEC